MVLGWRGRISRVECHEGDDDGGVGGKKMVMEER